MKSTKRLAAVAYIAILAASASDLASAEQPTAPKPLSPQQMQINELKSRIEAYQRNITSAQSVVDANRGLLATDQSYLSSLEAQQSKQPALPTSPKH